MLLHGGGGGGAVWGYLKRAWFLTGDYSSLLIKAICGILSRWQKAATICFSLCLHYSSLESWSFLYRWDFNISFFFVLFSPSLFPTHCTMSSLPLVSYIILPTMYEWNYKLKKEYKREAKLSQRKEGGGGGGDTGGMHIEFACCFWTGKWRKNTMNNLFF